LRAVRVTGPGTADLVDVEAPRTEPGEVLVRVEHAAICATDRRLAARGSEAPRIPGHEFVGRLDDGTLVGVHPDVGCGRCAECLAGLENRCPNRTSIGIDRDGGLAEHVAVPADHVVPLEGLDSDVSPVLEPLACCLHAVSLLDVRRGDSALVVGAGPMGILCTWALQDAGATVAVSQRSPERRALAAELGADAVLSPDQRPADVLGEEPRIAIVTAPGAEPLRWALEHVAVGGRVHVFAGTPEGAPIDANLVHYRHLTLVGSTGSALADYERARALVAAERVPLARLPRTTLPLDGAPAALLGRRDPSELKVIIDVEGGSR